MKRTKLIILIVAIVFFLDQLIKQVARINNIQTNNGVFDITYVTNTGSLWSLFSNVENINVFFIIFSFIALAAIIYVIKQEKDSRFTIPFALLLSGILGNLVDRIFFGAVIDWANLHFWPIFNIADSALVVGVCWVLFLSIRDEVKRLKKKYK